MGRLEGKTAVVTGASKGIGRAIALRFIHEGANVTATARNIPSEPFESSSAGPHFMTADSSDAAAMKAVIDETVERFGGLDILVNNAGVEIEKTVEETQEDEWDWLMAINLKGVFLGCKYAIAPMRARGGGSIINVGSYDGFVADPGMAAYCASKGGVHALSRAVAVDHGVDGIRCNVICPGWIRTEMMEQYLESQSNAQNAIEAIVRQHPIGRLGEPADIANLALWLASDESSFATGQLYVHDGGMTAHAAYVG